MNRISNLSAYKKWRWLIYHQLEESTIRSIELQGISEEDIKSNMYYERYNTDLLKQYYKNDFFVSESVIKEYDAYVINDHEKLIKEGVFLRSGSFRSVFIENCYIDANSISSDNIIIKIKANIIYFKWWDYYSIDEIIDRLINYYFLKSTQKLIPNVNLSRYIKQTFKNRDDLTDYLLLNFKPSTKSLNYIKNPLSGAISFDYNFLFYNQINQSIRVFENECREYFGESVIGSFYSENILYRRIKESFGDKYKIISQGIPEWLSPQRFDIYFPDLNIAIEYQGEQHFRPVDFGGKGKKTAKKQFIENQRRDEEKRQKSINNNCHLIYVNNRYKWDETKKIINMAIINKLKNGS